MKKSLLLLLSTFCLGGCQIGYIARQAWGQMGVLWKSRPVEEALSDPSLSSESKAKLLYIEEIVRFGEDEIGLRRNGNYTSFLDTRGEPISYNIFACPKTKLEPVVWSFPVIGRISYLGFFDLEEAREAKRELEEAGFDVHLGTVAAYSTLGWFRDPILSSMLEEDEIELARLILHEMTHGTVYRPGESSFNETLASFVGDRGAALFLQARFGLECVQQKQLQDRLRDEASFHAWLQTLEKRLRRIYASDLSDSEKISSREELFSAGRDELRALSESSPERPFQWLIQLRWNNALLLSLLTYRSEPTVFEEFFRKSGKALRRFLRSVEEIPPGLDAMRFLKRSAL